MERDGINISHCNNLARPTCIHPCSEVTKKWKTKIKNVLKKIIYFVLPVTVAKWTQFIYFFNPFTSKFNSRVEVVIIYSSFVVFIIRAVKFLEIKHTLQKSVYSFVLFYAMDNILILYVELEFDNADARWFILLWPIVRLPLSVTVYKSKWGRCYHSTFIVLQGSL